MSLMSLNASYTLKHMLILACIVVDLALNTVIDSASGTVPVLIMMGAQGVGRIVAMFIIMAAMWNTFVFKYGLLGALCQRFKFLLAAFPLSFVFLVAIRVMRAVSRQGGWA